MNNDFFISHSREVKTSVAIPIAQQLSSIGFRTWIDKKYIGIGENIFQNIEKAILSSLYCVAIIDSTFLTKSWTREELRLFHQKETIENRVIVLPIYINIDRNLVNQEFPWLENRAFEFLNNEIYSPYNDFEVLCRIVERYYNDISTITFDKLYCIFDMYDFPCKNTLLSLLKNPENFSTDLRLAIIELCNIGGLLHAIYNSYKPPHNIIIETSFNLYTIIRNMCFDANYKLTYTMYSTVINAIIATAEELKAFFDSL